MKFKELKGKSVADLKESLAGKKDSLRNFRFGIAGSKVRNMKEGRNLKKDIAKILTAIRSNQDQ